MGSTAPVSRSRSRRRPLSWLMYAALAAFFLEELGKRDIIWIFQLGLILALFALPAILFRDSARVPQWEIGLLVMLPAAVHVLLGHTELGGLSGIDRNIVSSIYTIGLSTIGFLIVAELEMFTGLRVNRPFAGFFVLLFTVSTAAFQFIVLYASDYVNYRSQMTSDHSPSIGTNDDMMVVFEWVTLVGLLLSVAYAIYGKWLPHRLADPFGPDDDPEATEASR